MRRRRRNDLPGDPAGVARASDDVLARLEELRGMPCYAFMSDEPIHAGTVSAIYEDLRERYGERGERLTVLVHTSGGDFHAAFDSRTASVGRGTPTG